MAVLPLAAGGLAAAATAVVADRAGREHFFFNDTATTEIYTLSLHDALPIFWCGAAARTSRWRCWKSLPTAPGQASWAPSHPKRQARRGAGHRLPPGRSRPPWRAARVSAHRHDHGSRAGTGGGAAGAVSAAVGAGDRAG